MWTANEMQRRSFLSLAGVLGLSTVGGALEPLLFEASARAADAVPLRLANPHTSESYDVQLFVGSEWNQAGLVACDWMMRDWRESQVVHCDRKLYAALYVMQRYFASASPIRVNSGFRSTKTNAMLRSKSLSESAGKAGWMTPAINSLHMRAKAVDFVVPGADLDRVAEAVWALGLGGLGHYPTFIHMDTGNRRRWGI